MDSRLIRLLAPIALRMFWLSALVGAVVAVSNAGTTSYTYDVHGRLKQVTSPSGTDQSVTTYTLDNAGNRQTVATTVVDTTAPNTPAGLSATATAFDTIHLDWTPSTDVPNGPIWYYNLYRGGQLRATPGAPPFDDTSLTANTTYSYRVSAVDYAGNESGQSTPPVSATTPNGPDLTPPSVPTNLQGSAVSGTRIDVTWNASTDTGGSGLAGYEVFRNNGGSPIASPSGTSYSDTSLTPATTYQYQVRAYDVAGNRSALSNQISVTTPDTIPPGAPGNPTFSAITGSTATAAWTAATDNAGVNTGVAGYRYRLYNGAAWSAWSADLGNVLSVNLTGLTAATNYTMEVQARDVAGNWGSSSGGTFTTSAFYTDTASLTGGFVTDGSTYEQTGYVQGGMGSLTPNTLTGGKSITGFYGYFNYQTYQAAIYLTVTGFSGNPGVGWLQSVSLGSLTLTSATALLNCQNSTTCTWYWPTYQQLTGGTLTIVHQ